MSIISFVETHIFYLTFANYVQITPLAVWKHQRGEEKDGLILSEKRQMNLDRDTRKKINWQMVRLQSNSRLLFSGELKTENTR